MKILRRAIARGLLQWDDVEAVSEEVATDGDARQSPPTGAWISALVDGGKLSWDDLDELEGEVLAEELAETPGSGPSSDNLDLFEPPPPRRSRLDRLQEWDRFEVVGFLGSGGMGEVYKAFDPALARFVALKFLRRDDPVQEERFLGEARAQARVDHPQVCQVYETGAGPDGQPYIAMQYLDGETLDEAARGLPPEAIARLVQEVADAVHAAHRTGLIHRDLKPGNILVTHTRRGLQPYVVDFGLAEDLDDQQTRTESLTGTPAYLSPEQIRGEAVDRRTDVYSLGVVLYELLAGKKPFEGDSVAQTLLSAVDDEPPPLARVAPGVAPDLEAIVARCLEKDPAARYESARALGQDLERYLDGEPVSAARQTHLYRWKKRLAKHRRLAAAAALAVLGLLSLAGLALRERWLAAERAELARAFGEQVHEMEAALRYAAMLPLHDTTRHREALLERMARVREEMDELGAEADGPGHYSLGRGYLALHQHEAAHEHLDRAWAAGYRTPETAAALGRVLGELYHRSLTEVERPVAPGGADAARRDLQDTFRTPAIQFLRESAASGTATPYVEALLALHEERWDDAIALSREAWQDEPWLFEARQVEADVHMARGFDALAAGRYDQAVRDYETAGTILAELLETVRSDPALYSIECGRRIRLAEARSAGGSLDPRQVEAALGACELALAADPTYGEAFAKQARIHYMLARHQMRRGDNPEGQLEAAVTAAHRAIEIDPDDLNAHGHLAITHRLAAAWRLGRGLDPSDDLDRAIEAAHRAIEIEPSLAASHNQLGTVLTQRARHDVRYGIDPRADLRRAVASYERSLTLDPTQSAPAVNLGDVWTLTADVEIELGLDPSRSVDRAIDALETALAVNPNQPAAHNNLGNAHLTLGLWQSGRGGDPRQSFADASRAYRQALDLHPDYGYGHYNLAYVERALAEYHLAQGTDPGPSVARALEALVEAERLNPADSDNDLERARLGLVSARWQAGRGRSPARDLDRSAAAVAAGLRSNPEDPALHLTAALVEQVRAEHALRTAGTPDGRLRAREALLAGLEAVERALDINPALSEALATRGVLHRLAARLEDSAESRAEQLRAARGHLTRALELNPSLEREYGPALAAVRSDTRAQEEPGARGGPPPPVSQPVSGD